MKKVLRWIWKQIDRFNFWFMSGLADLNATPWAFYLVTFAVLKVLAYQKPTDALGWIQYVVQTLYQGSALPLIAFISKREGAVIMKYLKETFDKVMQLLDVVAEVLKGQTADAERDREVRMEMLKLARETHRMHSEMKCRICSGQPDLEYEEGSEV